MLGEQIDRKSEKGEKKAEKNATALRRN